MRRTTMTELSGPLGGVGLPVIVRFLVGLKKSGVLRLNSAEWQGEIVVEAGQVTGARLGSLQGLSALDALVEMMPDATFAFDGEQAAEVDRNISLGLEELLAHLAEVPARLARGEGTLPPAEAVPVLAAHESSDDGEAEALPLDRGMLQTLMLIDGQRRVREIVAERGSLDALGELAHFAGLGLIELRSQAAAVPAPAQVEPVVQSTVHEPPSVHELSAADVDHEVLLSAGQTNGVHHVASAPTSNSVAGHCPQLGFEDDPSSSFDRPTRRHRCFATGTPLALSIDQQRELCLSEQFGTCPRLARSPNDEARQPFHADAEDPRIVRLPRAGRAARAKREVAAEGARSSAADPTPLRSRVQRQAAEPSSLVLAAQPPAPPPVQEPSDEEPLSPASGGGNVRVWAIAGAGKVPVWAIAGAGLALIVVATIVLFLERRLTTVPIASVATPVVGDTVAPQPTVAPVAQQFTAQIAKRTPASPSSGAASTLLNEHFINNDAGWASDPQGVAVVTSGSYRIATREAHRFVAIGAPITGVPADVVVSATFHKLGGPAGGGYGVVLRDQGPGARDGVSQSGRYYALEAGDKGEIGVWRRETDHWVDLLPWQHTDVVKPGTGINDIVVRAVGATLSMSVNGAQVATVSDGALTNGNVGVFVGGDGNQVALDHITIQTP